MLASSPQMKLPISRRPRRLTVAFAAALTATVASVPAPALCATAEPTTRELERFDRLYAEAERAFEEGRFEDARRLYLSAYDTIPDAAVLFNIAYICEKKLGNLELSEGYYERVAAHRDAPPELIDKAEARLATIRAAMSGRTNGTAPVNPPPPKEPPAPPELAPTAPDNLWPLVTVGAGGLMLVSGLALGGVALGVESRLANAETLRQVDRAASLRDSGHGLAAGADALIFGGLLVAAGGALWHLLDTSADTTGGSSIGPAAWRLAPSVGPRGGGIVFGGSL